VRDARGSDALDQLTGRIAHIVEQRLAGAEGDRDDVQVELVEQLGREVLRGSRPLRRRELDCARGAPPQRDGDVARAANLLARLLNIVQMRPRWRASSVPSLRRIHNRSGEFELSPR
jgi:hypothetical protein